MMVYDAILRGAREVMQKRGAKLPTCVARRVRRLYDAEDTKGPYPDEDEDDE